MSFHNILFSFKKREVDRASLFMISESESRRNLFLILEHANADFIEMNISAIH